MTATTHPHRIITDLQSRIEGAVLVPGDPGYDRSRTPYFANREGHPVAVVRPRHADDVARAVLLAREHDLPLSVRGGGHHAAGHSTGDGLLVDLGSLTGLRVGPDGGTVATQAGLTAGAVTRALGHGGLAVGFGDTGTVGIGGLTLAGGVGFLSRRHGLTVDQLLGAELVTADGRVRTVDADHDPDLFWAIRGGGGNFGIATRFHYRTVPVREVYAGTLFLPPSTEALAGLVAAAEAAPDELSVIATVLPMPPLPGVPPELHGCLVVMARICHCGPPARAVRDLRPLREVRPPVLDGVTTRPYADLFDEPSPSAGQVVTGRTMFLDHLAADEAYVVLEQLALHPASLRMVQVRVLGGAIARVDPAATAYAHRRSRIMVTVVSNDEPGFDEARSWVEATAARLQQEDRGAYVGFFGTHDADRIGAAYPPATFDRLRAVKAAYDPDNVFRHNDNIAPATGDAR